MGWWDYAKPGYTKPASAPKPAESNPGSWNGGWSPSVTNPPKVPAAPSARYTPPAKPAYNPYPPAPAPKPTTTSYPGGWNGGWTTPTTTTSYTPRPNYGSGAPTHGSYTAPYVAPRPIITAQPQAERPGGTTTTSAFHVPRSVWSRGDYTSSGGAMGMNIAQVTSLSNIFKLLRGDFDGIAQDVTTANTLAGFTTPTNTTVQLGEDSWTAGIDIARRAAELNGFKVKAQTGANFTPTGIGPIGPANQSGHLTGVHGVLMSRYSTAGNSQSERNAIRQPAQDTAPVVTDPRHALFLDLELGDPYDPIVADQAIAAGETYDQMRYLRAIDLLTRQLEHATPNRRAEILASIDTIRAGYDVIDPDNRGDWGGTLTAEIRTPFDSAGTTPYDQGVALISHALADTGDYTEVHQDEFQAIFHDNGKLTLVLPGVIDLPALQLGLNGDHASVRDADQHALRSSLDATLESNVYAQLVAQWLTKQVTAGTIEPGADVLIVGHSYGADTALDLASDPAVNGELVHITHVIPAAYHNEPQLSAVVNNTQVGVLQNIFDVVVVAGGVASDLVGVASVAQGDDPGDSFGGGLAGVGRLVIEGGEQVLATTAGVINGFGKVVNIANDLPAAGVALPDVPVFPTDIELMGDTVRPLPEQGFVAEFEGTVRGPHSQRTYIDYLKSDDHPPVVIEMFDDIGEHYGSPGVSVAIDVSTPGAKRTFPRSAVAVDDLNSDD